jgi:CRISPR/Cas system-associated protein Csx1
MRNRACLRLYWKIELYIYKSFRRKAFFKLFLKVLFDLLFQFFLLKKKKVKKILFEFFTKQTHFCFGQLSIY